MQWKKFTKKCKKYFVKKWERVGLEEHAHWSNKKFENKIVGWYSLCML